MDETEIRFRDFTKKRKPIQFKVDDDFFECAPALAPDSLQELMSKIKTDDFKGILKASDAEKALKAIRDVFGVFLLEGSYDTFVARLGDRRNPIDVHQLLEIVQWIVEIYTARPIEPSGASSNGSGLADGGISSMDGAQLTESPL